MCRFFCIILLKVFFLSLKRVFTLMGHILMLNRLHMTNDTVHRLAIISTKWTRCGKLLRIRTSHIPSYNGSVALAR